MCRMLKYIAALLCIKYVAAVAEIIGLTNNECVSVERIRCCFFINVTALLINSNRLNSFRKIIEFADSSCRVLERSINI